MTVRLNRQATIYRKATPSDPEYVAPSTAFGTDSGGLTPISGYEAGSPLLAKRIWGERQDILPSRSEGVSQGLIVGRNQVRWRMRWRNDIDSSMLVVIHGDADETYQIVAGPAEYGGRKRYLELVLERYTS